MSFWNKVQAGAKKAGTSTKLAAQKTKLRGDMMMIDREIQTRKKSFGVAMYDHVSPLSQSQDFYAANDALTNILRPPLISTQKEIQALAAKRVNLMEQLAAAEAKRAGAFPQKAETVGQKFVNFGKAGAMHSGETKIKAELAIVDSKIKGHKQNFGLALYPTFVDAEDNNGFLPTDRQVRSIYDTCRGDIHRMETSKENKAQEIKALGGTTEEATTPALSVQDDGNENGNGNTNIAAPPIQPTTGYTDSYAPNNNNNRNNNTNPNQMEDLLL